MVWAKEEDKSGSLGTSEVERTSLSHELRALLSTSSRNPWDKNDFVQQYTDPSSVLVALIEQLSCREGAIDWWKHIYQKR